MVLEQKERNTFNILDEFKFIIPDKIIKSSGCNVLDFKNCE